VSKLLCVAVLAASCFANCCGAGESLTIVLADGRSAAGQVDQATSADRLWLRRESNRVTLVSGFSWNEVIQGSVERRALFGDDVQTWALKNRTPAPTFRDLKAEPAAAVPETTRTVAPVATLVIEAVVAQWDNDSQTDGVRVFVSPLNAQGQIVPVQGQIEFTLVTETEKLSGGQSGSLIPTFTELERKSFIVRPRHFTRGPAVYEIPFTGQHPEFVTTLAPQALLHARLGVPGRGVFEASTANVCIRECNRFRDQLQYYTPSRQLPLESGGQQNR
jgi:hypothetical protein